MIISFSVSNFRSFLGEETLSMVASGRITGEHETHAVHIPTLPDRVLQASVIYGANGAGKSNLFKALRFMKSSALESRRKAAGTGRNSFAFADGNSEPSIFDIQFVSDDKVYRYGFKMTDSHVAEEWVVRLSGTKERTVFQRQTTSNGITSIEAVGLRGKKVKALAIAGAPQNQTFLATINTVLEDTDFGTDLSSVIKWFRWSLVFIAPDTPFQPLAHFLAEDNAFLSFAGTFLRESSTGIAELEVDKAEITEDELKRLVSKEEFRKLVENPDDDDDESVVISRRLGEGHQILVEKGKENHIFKITVTAIHRSRGNKKVALDLSQESDGTRRLLNLLPALQMVINRDAVFFIDEIDRSMHPILVHKFLESFLKLCGRGRRQIIVTTHESSLLDLSLLRRDEIWFAEKDENGATHMFSLVDFKVRKDLEIRKHYLQGRFGAIPFLWNIDNIMEIKCESKEAEYTKGAHGDGAI